MDAKITKKRLSEMFQYDWIKILLTIIAAIIVWELVFTTSAVRLGAGQTFKVIYYSSISSAGTSSMTDFIDKKVGLSYDVLETNVEALDSQYGATVLAARTSTGEGDIMVIDNELVHAAADDKKDNPLYDTSNFMQMADSYMMYNYEQLYADAKDYLAQFMVGETYAEDAEFSAENIEQHFRKQMKNDNRYRSATNFAAGLADETARLETLRDEVKTFGRLLADYGDTELFFKYVRYQSSYYAGENEEYKEAYEKSLAEGAKIYGLNAGFLEREENRGGKPAISSMTALASSDNLGKSEGVAIMVFNFLSRQPDLQFETITFINTLVRNYSTLLD